MNKSVLDNAFQLLEELGRGGFGAVYRAVRIGFEGSGAVAIKILNKNPSASLDEYYRFQREAVIMSQLVHGGVVTVHELGEEAGCYYIVMEYVEGANLKNYIKDRGGSLPLTEILEILIQAADALEYVHGHKIVHRDIKPQNILVCKVKDGSDQRIQIKLVDFGVARLNESFLTESLSGQLQKNKSEMVGTYAYMSPEATGLTRDVIDQRSDIYSLGIVAFEMLAGKVPFQEKEPYDVMMAHVNSVPPTLEQVRGNHVPEIFEAIVKKCIEKRPDSRYQSMFALACDLRLIQKTLSENRELSNFTLATKDIGLQALFGSIFVGRELLLENILQHILQKSPSQQGRLSWSLVRGGVGMGKTRLLKEVMFHLQKSDRLLLYIKFTESERGLPFQSFSFFLNDFLITLSNSAPTKYKELQEKIVERLGEGVASLAALIPSLRPLLKRFPSSQAPMRSAYSADNFKLSDVDKTETLHFVEHIDRQSAVESLSLNISQSFYELLDIITDVLGEFVLLLDDIYLADSATLNFLQFLAEKVNESVDFQIVLSMRDRTWKSDLALESLLRSLANLRRRLRIWDVPALGYEAVEKFLHEIGVASVSQELVSFVLSSTAGSPFQLHALVKQMIASNVLQVSAEIPRLSDETLQNPAPVNLSQKNFELIVDWQALSTLQTEFINIEVLITHLELLDSRDKEILNLVAVSQEACEFDFFMVDPELSKQELESRLVSLVKRGFLQAVNDDSVTIFRQSFLLTHEKMRATILQQIGSANRRVLHLRLAQHIEALYRNPTRYHVLLLAKHYDGAGDLAEPESATRAFLYAIRVLVRKQQHSLAKYYIDKTIAKSLIIKDDSIRKKRLRDVYEAEYTICAVQGNLIAAAEICQRLIPMTEEQSKKEVLQVFLAQLLLALGQQKNAHKILSEVLIAQRILTNSRWARFAQKFYFACCQLPLLQPLANVVFWKRPLLQPKDVSIHALVLKLLAELHGAEKNFKSSLFAGMALYISRLPPSRWSAMFAFFEAIHLMRHGRVQEAFRMAEKIERFLLARGHNDAVRWVRALQIIWLDYPLGKTTKLCKVLENKAEGLLPSSGLLHFESNAIRSWMRLLSPTSTFARVADELEKKQRRFDDRVAPASNPARTKVGNADWSLESLGSRRVLDAGENGHFTSLALFSDAVRYSLSEKVDPLQRACDQLGRQKNVSAVGQAFSFFALALLNIITGKHRDGKKRYEQGLKTLESVGFGALAMPVTDALMFAMVFVPLSAIGSRAKGWPWGRRWLALVMPAVGKLKGAEGSSYPKRLATKVFFEGFSAHMAGKPKLALRLLGQAAEMARSQKLELIEFLSLLSLGMQLALVGQKRAQEAFEQAMGLAHQLGWKMLEKHVSVIARRLRVPLRVTATMTKITDATNRKDTSYSKFLGSVLGGIQRMSGQQSVAEIAVKACTIAQQALQADQAFAYMVSGTQSAGTEVDGELSNRAPVFACVAQTGLTPMSLNATAVGKVTWQENEIKSHLVRSSAEAVRVVLLQQKLPFAGQNNNEEKHPGVAQDYTVLQKDDDDLAGLTQQFSDAEPTKTGKTEIDALGKQPSATAKDQAENYLVMIALRYKSELLGWVCVPGVNISNYVALDIEQELQLLGLHCGHLLRHLATGAVVEQPEFHFPPESRVDLAKLSRQSADGGLPKNIFLEGVGFWKLSSDGYFRVFSIPSSLVLVVNCEVKGGQDKINRELMSAISRHLEFFVTSLRNGNQHYKANILAQKLSADFATLLESFFALHKISEILLTFILIDSLKRICFEVNFGQEKFGFSGNFSMQSETVKEVGLLNGNDRLILRENHRALLGTCGWMFAFNRKSQGDLPKFAGANFMENYLLHRRSQTQALKLALGESSENSALACLCIFYLDEQNDQYEKYVG